MSENKVAKQGDSVTIKYVGKLEDGTVFDASEHHGNNLEFIIGEKKLLPEFENSIIGMEVGQTKTIEIKSENAYGQRKEELVQKIDKKQLPEGLDVKVGQKLRAKHDTGDEIVVDVIDVADDTITIDVNHPLAGKDLTFDITLEEIKNNKD